ncbi:MAG: 30S ribosomal protein S6 [Bacteroidota bacterium]
MKRFYETTFIVNASLDDQQVEAAITKVQDTIEKNGGQIKALEKIGRKRLAYPISKKNNGFYVSIEFVAASNLIDQLERFYEFEENILRFLTVVVDNKVLKARQLSLAQSQDSRAQVQAGSQRERTELVEGGGSQNKP